MSEHPGKLYINSNFVVDSTDAGSKLDYSFGGAQQSLTTQAASDAKAPQGLPLTFDITQPGWQTLAIRLDSLPGKEAGKIHRLELFGPAAANARMLRARWRPAACHARFSSCTVAAPKLWVMIPLSGLDLAAGENATLTVFYGPEDCLTFDRELGYREVKTRFWPHHSKPVSATDGANTIELRDLAAGVTNHFRILIESPRGRIWSSETDQFSTSP